VVERNKPAEAAKFADEVTSEETSSTEVRSVGIPRNLSVRQLADLLSISAVSVIKRLMRDDIIASINQVVDYEMAAAVAVSLGYEARPEPRARRGSVDATVKAKRRQMFQGGETGELQPRPPVVTVMGHVNHGKTRLLDAVRQTDVMATEAGGITQHIGACQVEINGQKITFLDTPGHEAFTAMRAHGAQVTDITVLVVAADDGVMPQTLEAIDHARAAGVPVVVAINKIDKPEANPELVKQQLADAGLLIEEWGGDTVCVPISAKEKKGISELLENVLVVAEVEDLRANPARPAMGTVIEAELDKARGPLATVLVHNGSLKVGDVVVVGTTWGRVRAMFNDRGKRVKKAEPSTPVAVLGLSSVPQVGDTLMAVANETQARSIIQEREREMRQGAKPVSLTTLSDQISAGEVKELNVVLKADVQGSIEPIRASLERLGADEARVRVVHSGSGNISESDVMLAIASKGLVIGFNTSAELGARRLAEVEGVSIRYYDVIYDLVADVEKALKGILEPSLVEVIDGRAEVRAVFSKGKGGKAAGVYVTEGKLGRGAFARVWRGEQMLCESPVSSLKRFKDDVKEVATGFECGVGIKDFNEFQVGDIVEVFHTEEVA